MGFKILPCFYFKNKFTMRKIILLLILFVSTAVAKAQDTIVVHLNPPVINQYVDYFANTRAPYRYRIYEKEVLADRKILRVDTIWVSNYLNKIWLRGMIEFTGDTSKLIFQHYEYDKTFPKDSWLRYIRYPVYIYQDTIYKWPTIEGFETWKIEKGYK